MNILILNWRDPNNPRSGGAEAVTFKYAQYWADNGNTVRWICNRFPGCLGHETVSGIKFIRIGPELGFSAGKLLITYPLFLWNSVLEAIATINKNKIDLVIDEIHGLPFFSPFFYKGRKVLWVCEVADQIWNKMFPFPVNFIGIELEKFIYSLYATSEIWAISNSTKLDILSINPTLTVNIIPLGIDKPKTIYPAKKNVFPSAVFLARIVRMKGAESAIDACAAIVKKYPTFKLYMLGTGTPEYVNFLKNKAKALGVKDAIVFLGKVSEEIKNEMLQKADFLIHPSYKEGFGLTILEAGIHGTPTIARQGSSLDELIENRDNGLLFTKEKDISSLFIKYYNSTDYNKMAAKIRTKSEKYVWSQILVDSKKVTKV